MRDKENKKEKNNATEKSDKKKTKKTSLAKRILKISAWVIGSLFALLLLLVLFRDPIIKYGVTTIGSWATGVDISLESLDTSLFNGTVNLKGLRISNPKDFKRPDMLTLEEFDFALEVPTLFSKEIVINKLIVKNLTFTAEFDSKANFNLSVVADNIQKRFAPAEPTPAPEENTPPQETPEENTAPQEENTPPQETPEENTESTKPAILIRELALSVKLILQDDRTMLSLSAPINYSTKDMRTNLKDDGTHWTTKMIYYTEKFEEWCKACFEAGGFIMAAGVEAWEGATDVFKRGVNSGKQVLDSGKSLFDSTRSLFSSGK